MEKWDGRRSRITEKLELSKVSIRIKTSCSWKKLLIHSAGTDEIYLIDENGIPKKLEIREYEPLKLALSWG